MVETASTTNLTATTEKLTSWAKEPTLLALKGDFEASKSSHDAQVTEIKRWVDLNDVTGSEKPPKVPGRSSVQPKLIRRQAEWRYSALTEPFLGSDKLFEVSPVTFEDKHAAVQNELVLNHQFRNQINKQSFIDEFIRTTVDEGTSILRVGWERETKMVDEEVPVYSYYAVTEEDIPPLREAMALRGEDPRMFEEKVSPELKAAIEYFDETQQATVAKQVGTVVQQVEKVLVNRPTLEILNYENVYFDPSCGSDLDKAMFLIASFETSKSELLKAGKRYKNLDKIDWEAAGPVTNEFHASPMSGTAFQFQDIARKKVVAYEYWGFYDVDGNGELTPIVATWIGNTIIRMEKNPYPDGKIPFVLVPYLPRKRKLFGETDAELLGDNQKILGAVTRGMIDLMGKSANSQRGIAKGLIDPLNRKRFEAGQNYDFNPSMPIANGIYEHKYPEIPRSAIEMVTMVNQEAEAMSGVKSFAGGVSGDSYGDVAAGIRGALDAASKREMAILRRLSKGLMDVGKKFISMNAVFLSEKEVVRITNDEFVEVFREELAGSFDLIVDISTAEIDNAQAQDLGFMLQTMGPNMDFSLTQMILAEIARLKRLPDLAKAIERFQPQPDPLEEKRKELEIAELEAKIEEIKAKAEEARAKARKALAEADQADLDFAEQADGVKHARDLERGQSQAEGNQDLQVTKALLQPRKEGEKEPDIAAGIGFNQLSASKPNLSRPSIDNTVARDALAMTDPSVSLNSSFFEPNQDPALNPAINI